MVDVAMEGEDAEVHRGWTEAQRRLVGDAHRIDVALLVLPHEFGVGASRLGQRRRSLSVRRAFAGATCSRSGKIASRHPAKTDSRNWR